MLYREATTGDVSALVSMRKRQLSDEGMAATNPIDAELTEWYEQGLSDGRLTVWVAEEDGDIVAVGALLYMQFPPSFKDPGGRRGYLNSLYTAPSFRGHGIATVILGKLMDAAKTHGVRRLWVGASRLGRRVLPRYGFRESDEWLEMEI